MRTGQRTHRWLGGLGLPLTVLLVLTLPTSATGQGTCTPFAQAALGNGNDGEAIAYNPNDGLLYHASGIDPGEEFFETVDPNTFAVGPNLLPGDSSPAVEVTGMAWYPPLGAFLAMDLNQDIFSVSTTGVFTPLSTFAGPNFLRGFAVVAGAVYGCDPFSEAVHQFDPTTGALLDTIIPTLGGSPVELTGMYTQPGTGDVHVIHKIAGTTRGVGILNLGSGVITDLGTLTVGGAAGITFDSLGRAFVITGDGGSPSETLFTDFDCVIPPVPVESANWGALKSSYGQ